MYNVKIDNEVYLQLQKIKKYYEENNFDLKKIQKIQKKLYKTIDNLEEFAYLGSEINHDSNYRKIIIENYIFIYRIEEDRKKIFIISMYSTRQKGIFKRD